ncbi:MAG: metallophosphoesterase family protein [Herpetosiphonaceae bacterium]|nr:metallophosphoesterase family protein [Herpetosiphonaceae bacterium]
MRIVLVSDIHSNAVALDAVLAAAPQYDQLWCIGDTIGYGPQPNLCLARMSTLATHALTGNHDLACLGLVSLAQFNPVARTANQWNNEQLEPEMREWLQARPARQDLPDVTLAHASPRDPIWEYILDVETADANLDHFTAPLCIVGHSHVPLIFAHHAEGNEEFRHVESGQSVQLKPTTRYIFNPGSVGQPRDNDPRAAYAVWDTESNTLRLNRVPYDISATQKMIRDAKLPAVLADRLAVGR